MSMAFLDSLDIANRVCDHCGVDHIDDITEDTVRNNRISAVYNQLRQAELERNVWRFSIKETVLRAMSTTSLILVPADYDATRTYSQGDVVADVNRNLWVSRVTNNLNNQPGANNEAWDMYFGPMSVDKWDSTIGYNAGELVYIVDATAPNGFQIYMSMISGNTDTPNTTTAYDATVQYNLDQAVSYGGQQWRSILPVNIGNTPAEPANAWASGTAYSIGDKAAGSNSHTYTAVAASTGVDPVTDSGANWSDDGVLAAWDNTPAILPSSVNWRPLYATLTNPFLMYPIGSGPYTDSASRNVYRLPAGYLKVAPQDPKAGSMSVLGAPSNNQFQQWDFENEYIVAQFDPTIRLRFAADVTRVTAMNSMFCEGLAARIALEVCETLTQSTTKLQAIATEYSKFMSEARTVNAIEIGAVEPPLDDWISCRL